MCSAVVIIPIISSFFVLDAIVTSAVSPVVPLKEPYTCLLPNLFQFCCVLFIDGPGSATLSSVLDKVRSVVRSAFTASRGGVSGCVAIT